MTTTQLPVNLQTFASREEWLHARATYGIGSSDVPALLGISRFSSALSLYYEKLGLEKPHARHVEAAHWGHLLEEPISVRYAEETHRTIINPNADGRWSIARHPDHPFMIASCDRFIVDCPVVEGAVRPPVEHEPGVLEAKNAHLMMQDEWLTEHNNEPPVEYQVQLQHQLACTGLRWGSIAALIGGCIFVWADLPRDEALIERLVEVETEFMGRLERHEPPAADGSEATRDVLKRLYPKDTGEIVVLPADAIGWHKSLVDAKARKKLAGVDEDLYENLLRQAIGEATMGVLPGGGAYTNKLQGRGEFVSKATEYRVLRYTKKA